MVEKLPPALADHPRRLIVYRSPVIAIISGVFVGLLAWVASKVVNRLEIVLCQLYRATFKIE